MAPAASYPNLVNQTMPNMPNYSGSVSGAFPGLLGMIPGVVSGASGGAILPGIGKSLGEICREYLSGRCAKTDCKSSHPPHNLLMTALAATTTMGTLSQVPMAPSAAAMAAAMAIVTAQALQAHSAQAQANSSKDSSAILRMSYILLLCTTLNDLIPSCLRKGIGQPLSLASALFDLGVVFILIRVSFTFGNCPAGLLSRA